MQNDNLKNIGFNSDMLRTDTMPSVNDSAISNDSDSIDLTVNGQISGSELHIPSSDTPNSFNVENDGDTYWGATKTTWIKNRNNVPAYVLRNGKSRFADIDIGFRYKTLSSGDNIQTAINDMPNGGILFLKAGTYTVSSDITGVSGLQIQGESESTTIINFDSNSASLEFVGTSVYTTGTISSITSGVNVTGTGTSWSANASAGQHIFLGTRWYLIAVVIDDTHIVLGEGFSDTTPSTYRIATIVTDINISNVTIKNSADDGLIIMDARNVQLKECIFLSNNVGVDFNNVSIINSSSTQIFSSTSDGAQFTNCGLASFSGFLTVSNGGNGITINNLKTFQFRASSSSSNTGDGINATSYNDGLLEHECVSNGGQGIEFVATSNRVFIQNCLINGNTSDGIKLTATCDTFNVSNNQILNNSGYGINIAAATCDNNIIYPNQYSNNTSGNISDGGTGTLYGRLRVSSEASSATPTININNVDAHSITALAEAVTSMTTNLSGTPTNFQKLTIRFKDNATARAIAWGASFENKGVTLPTTTVISKVLTVELIYDSVTSKWGCVAAINEA